MRTAFLFTFFALLVASSVRQPIKAAPTLSSDPITVSLKLDRDEYIEREPVFAEWTISNASREPVAIVFTHEQQFLRFHGTSEDGVTFPISSGMTSCMNGSRITPTTLNSGDKLRGWVDLREYVGLHGRGRFSAHCVYDPQHYGEANRAFARRVVSNKVKCRIAEAKGADAAAVELIDRARRDYWPLQFNKPIDPSLDESGRRLALGEKEYQGGLFLHRGEFRQAILEKTRSPRFRAAALFYQGRADMGFHLKEEEQYRKASESFKACSESEGASRYLQGLALMHWMQCQLEVKADESRKEAERLAGRLLKDYPDSCLADEATKTLKALRPDAK